MFARKITTPKNSSTGAVPPDANLNNVTTPGMYTIPVGHNTTGGNYPPALNTGIALFPAVLEVNITQAVGINGRPYIYQKVTLLLNGNTYSRAKSPLTGNLWSNWTAGEMLGQGKVIQTVYAENTTIDAACSAFTLAGEIPQLSSGTLIASVTITPNSMSNKFVLTGNVHFEATGAHSYENMAAIFRNAEANAVAHDMAREQDTNEGINSKQTIRPFRVIPISSLTEHTFTLKAGPGTLNYRNGMASTLMVQEIDKY